jgi:hypothetical protein
MHKNKHGWYYYGFVRSWALGRLKLNPISADRIQVLKIVVAGDWPCMCKGWQGTGILSWDRKNHLEDAA